jgi:hypothetical protein
MKTAPRPVPTSSVPGPLPNSASDGNRAGEENSERSFEFISVEEANEDVLAGGAHNIMVCKSFVVLAFFFLCWLTNFQSSKSTSFIFA